MGRGLDAPEGAAVLVPRQRSTAARALGEEHRAVERDRAVDQAARDALEQRVADESAEQRIDLQLFDLAVVARRTLPAVAEGQVLIATGRRVALEEQPVV